MKVIICLDDNSGMIFGGKRQSRDSKVLEDIKNENEKVVILPFSEKLIAPSGINYEIKNDISQLQGGECVFIESINPQELEGKISTLVVYKWNRKYLSDMKCTLDLKAFKLESRSEFVGSSHDKITKEVYKR